MKISLVQIFDPKKRMYFPFSCFNPFQSGWVLFVSNNMTKNVKNLEKIAQINFSMLFPFSDFCWAHSCQPTWKLKLSEQLFGQSGDPIQKGQLGRSGENDAKTKIDSLTAMWRWAFPIWPQTSALWKGMYRWNNVRTYIVPWIQKDSSLLCAILPDFQQDNICKGIIFKTNLVQAPW